MFRYSIQESLIVNLKDELREVNNYVTIQTIRFKDRLYADFDIEEETLETPVPIFLLQLLWKMPSYMDWNRKKELDISVSSLIWQMMRWNLS